MLTVVEDMDPASPRWWEDAAKITTCEIFDAADEAIARLKMSGITELEGHFEGMINSSNIFEDVGAGPGPMYWADEFKILGAIAAVAGMRNSENAENNPSLLDDIIRNLPTGKIESDSKNTIFDSWMSRELVTTTLIKKQNDYGHNNVARFGRQGLLVRVHDKIARIKNLQKPGKSVKNESITDTYIDIVGYSVIGIMWERNWFMLPLGTG
jgi:hypothetical protein